MTKRKKIQIYDYTVVFEEAEEGGYIVYAPALPGCVSQGETFEETQRMAKDAIEGYLLTLKDFNEEIPKESENLIITRIPARVAV